MTRTPTPIRRLFRGAAAILGAAIAVSALAQPAPSGGAPGPSPGRQAIEARKAVFTLIGGNFRPLGAILKGDAPFDPAGVQKGVSRIAFLVDMLDGVFPEASNFGEPDTKAKAEIWSNRADFDQKLKDFQDHAKALVSISTTETSATDVFKTAVATVGQDCKGCHDDYKVK